jgi:hypothetical protein
MSPYRHTQIGYLTICALGTACLLVTYRIFWGGDGFAVQQVVALVILFACLVTFSSMTIEISDGFLSWWFGFGLIRKSVPLVNIMRGSLVRVKWYHGWGIHLTGNGWLYNVSGLRAVEFRKGDGTSFQLGTDEPEVLLAAVMTHFRG